MFPSPRRRPLRALAVAVVLLSGATLVGCGGSGSGTADTTATTEPPLPVDQQLVGSSPATVTLGREFSLVLPAEPTAGRRWVVTAYDPAVLLPLGIEFEQDPRLLTMGLAATTTTTTAPAPPTTAAPNASTSTTTTTTPPRPDRAQLISFAPRAIGTTTITLRYDRVGITDPLPTLMTFRISVVR